MDGSRLLLNQFDAAYLDLVRFLTRRTGNADDARDLAHDTWIRLSEQQDRTADGAPPDNPRAYLFTMAHHVAIDHLRRGQRLHDYLRDGGHGAADGMPHSPDVADSAMYRQALQVVQETLAALPERCRDIFLAHRLHGEPQPAIAQRLGVALNTVERDMMLANKQMEAAMLRWRGSAPAPAKRSRRQSLAALLGIGALCTAGLAAWHGLREETARWHTALRSQRGQRLRQPLPDGSSIELDALSQLDVAYYDDRRSVRLLQGAAFFAVASDAARPFSVVAGPVEVTVLGTRFAVEMAGSGADIRVQVQVESGRVQVRQAGTDARVLQAGESLTLDARGAGAVRQGGIAAPWRQGELVFDATPLGMAVERLARYAPFPLAVDAPAAQLPVSGNLRIALARDWLQALPQALPVRVLADGDGGLRITRQ